MRTFNVLIQMALLYALHGVTMLALGVFVVEMWSMLLMAAPLISPLAAVPPTVILIASAIVALLAHSTATNKRPAIHHIEHDAFLVDLDVILLRVFKQVIGGAFDSVPEVRRFEEVKRTIEKEFDSLYAKHVDITAAITTRFAEGTMGLRESELRHLRDTAFRADEKARQALQRVHDMLAKIREIELTAERLRVTRDTTSEIARTVQHEHAELTGRLHELGVLQDDKVTRLQRS